MAGVIKQFDRWGQNLISSSTTDSTPDLDLSNPEGATANYRLSMVGNEDDLLRVDGFSVPAGFAGFSTSSATLSDGTILSLSLEHLTYPFNQQVTVLPMYGSSNLYARHIMAACGMDETGIPFLNISDDRWWPGYVGDAWTLIKELTAFLNQCLESTAPRLSTFSGQYIDKSTDVTSEPGSADITVNYYQRLPLNEMYPGAVSTADQHIFSVDAGETIEEEIQLDAWVSDILPPVAMDYVGPEAASTSRYCVAGADNLPVKASQWIANGGSLKVSLTDDPSVIRVQITAPSTPQLEGVDGIVKYAPYQIAATTTEGGLYNSLHLTGTGYAYLKKQVNVRTGSVQGVDNIEIDSPVVATKQQAYDVAQRAIRSNDGLSRSLEATVRGAVVPGSRVRDVGGFFRVLSTDATPESTSISAVQDTIFSDFQDFYSGMTFADFQTLFAGKTFQQFKIHALREQ